MAKAKKSSSRKVKEQGSNKTKYIAIILIIGIPLAVWGLYALGQTLELFAPPQQASGKFQIQIQGIDGNALEDATFDLIYWDNETFYLQDQNQSTVFEPNIAMLCYVDYPGYYPKTIVVEASGNSSVLNNTISLYPFPSTIETQMIQLNGTYGDFDKTNMGNLNGSLTCKIEVNAPDSYFGLGGYYANCTLDQDSYGWNNSIHWQGLWIAFNCSIDDMFVNNASRVIYEDLTINGMVYNVVQILAIYNHAIIDLEFSIDSVGQDVSCIIYDGLIDAPFNSVTVL